MRTILVMGAMVAAAAALTPLPVRAGANSASLRCVSTAAKRPKLTIDATIPRDIYAFRMTLSGPAGVATLDEATAQAEAIEDFDKGVFSLVVIGTEPNVVLYALPATVRHTSVPGGIDARFAGVLVSAPDPGAEQAGGYKTSLSNLPISCVYHYSI